MGLFKRNSGRPQKFRDLCLNFHLRFLDSDDYGVKTFMKYFELYHRSGKISNLCQSKSEDLAATYNLFDYTYTIQAGNHSRRFRQTVFFVQDSTMHLPVFMMKPEHVGHKIAAYFGWDDIDFDTHQKFSDDYHLKGENEAWIRSNFKEPVLTFFSKSGGWHVEAANYYLLFYDHNTLIPENTLFDFYKKGLHVHKLFKESQLELEKI